MPPSSHVGFTRKPIAFILICEGSTQPGEIFQRKKGEHLMMLTPTLPPASFSEAFFLTCTYASVFAQMLE